MKRVMATISAAALLSACASPPESFKHDDFVWKHEVVGIGAEEAYKRIVNGSRRCVGINYLQLSGYNFPESKTGYFDMFLPNFAGIPSSYVGGKVEYSEPQPGTAHVSIGTLKKYYTPKDSMGFNGQIEWYLAGNEGCWTPE